MPFWTIFKARVMLFWDVLLWPWKKPGFFYMNLNSISNQCYGNTWPHRAADTMTTVDLLGFECFEHLSYYPDCTLMDVAVFAAPKVWFTWKMIHWCCRNSPWIYSWYKWQFVGPWHLQHIGRSSQQVHEFHWRLVTILKTNWREVIFWHF